MRRSIRSRVSVLLLLLSVGAAGEDFPVGAVLDGVLNLPIAAAPGQRPYKRLRGSPALVLEARTQGKIWLRILAADGSHGWIPADKAPSRIAPVLAGELFDTTPDSPEFPGEAREFRFAGGRVAGATRGVYAAALEDNGYPVEGSPFLLPWLKIDVRARAGWQHPARLRVSWSGAAGEGLIRPPFAQPDWAPSAAGALTAESLAGPFFPADSRPIVKGEPHAFVSIPGAGPSEPSRMAVFVSGRALTIGVASTQGAPRWITVESGPAALYHYESADLNGDGRRELMLEFAQIYGDGWYSTLWIVDGAGPTMRIRAAPLAGESGEPGSSRVTARWWVDEGRLWRVQLDKALHATVISLNGQSPRPPFFAVTLMQTTKLHLARQEQFAAQGHMAVFPLGSVTGDVIWGVGRVFERRTAALRWRNLVGKDAKIIAIP